MIWSTDKGGGEGTNTPWPVHEVGRNADFFPPEAGRLLKAGSSIVTDSVHLHSNGRDTKAHLEIGFKFHPKGYKPAVQASQSRGLGNGVDISIKPMEANQQLHAYTVLQEHTKITSFEPHLHAPGARMCLEAIWGYNIQTLSCVGLRPQLGARLRLRRRCGAAAAEGHDPAHHRLHGQLADQQERAGSAELAGLGQSLGGQHVHRPRPGRGAHRRAVPQEMAKRRQKLKLTKNDVVIGCPLCPLELPAPAPRTAAGANP